MLIFSQVILSVQLSFAVIPLVQFTGDRLKMGPFVNGWATRAIGWTLAVVIFGLNAYLVYTTFVPGPDTDAPMQFSIHAPPDFSFQETVNAHGWRRLLPFLWDEAAQTLERVEELTEWQCCPASECAAKATACALTRRATARKRTSSPRVRRMLQLDLPLSALPRLLPHTPGTGHIVECRQGRMLRCPTLYEDAVKVIATSNTTWAQTIAMTARLVEHFGAPLPSDPQRRAFPTPQRIAAVPFDEFAAKARMGYRNAYVHQIATDIAKASIDLEAWQDESLDGDGPAKAPAVPARHRPLRRGLPDALSRQAGTRQRRQLGADAAVQRTGPARHRQRRAGLLRGLRPLARPGLQLLTRGRRTPGNDFAATQRRLAGP